MEGSNSPESFESFKTRIIEIRNNEGLSANLLSEIDRWHERRQQETDMPGGTIEQRVMFQIELAELYIATRRLDLAYDTLNDAWTEADQEGLADLVSKITDMMNKVPEF